MEILNINNFEVRYICESDFHKNYLNLLSQLSVIDIKKILYNDFCNFLKNKHVIIQVIEDKKLQKIIGTITILKEKKLIHNLGVVSHIEDFIIDEKYRGFGLGKILLNNAIELSKDCYKIILNCSDKNVEYYKKFGFIQKEYQMVYYNNLIAN